MSVIVVNKVLDDLWAAHVSDVLRRGEGDGYYTAPRAHPGSTKSFVAFRDKEGGPEDVVGILTYAAQSEPQPSDFFVNVLYVLPPYRGRGVGGSLLNAAADLAITAGCSDFRLCVMGSNGGMLRLLDKVNLEGRSFRLCLEVVDC